MQQDKTYYYLDLGDLGQDHEAEVVFNWYKAPVQREDDYDELEIDSATIEINGIKLNVVDLLSKSVVEELEVICWESLEGQDEV